MEKITVYRWRSTIFETEKACAFAIGEAIGAILTKHARALANITSYSATLAYLESNAGDFAEVERLQSDLLALSELDAAR